MKKKVLIVGHTGVVNVLLKLYLLEQNVAEVILSWYGDEIPSLMGSLDAIMIDFEEKTSAQAISLAKEAGKLGIPTFVMTDVRLPEGIIGDKSRVFLKPISGPAVSRYLKETMG